jgi:RNA polymerase sigma factor (sigma-70 family)
LKTSKLSSGEEKRLWSELRAGNETAFEKVMQTHYKGLFNYGTKFTRDTEFLKDCLQDLFLEIWKNHRNLGETESVRFYLLKSFRRKIFRQLAKHQNFQIQSLDDEYCFDIVFSPETSILQEQSQQELSLKLIYLLNQLPRRQKEVIYLRYYQELDIDQIVDLMDITHQSVYNLLHKALSHLKEYWVNEKLSLMVMLSLIF